MQLSRDAFAAWLDRYVAAWRSRDPADIGDLFSADCRYSYRAGTRVVEGRDAIVAAWLADESGDAWEAHYEPLAVDGEVHVAMGWTRYLAPGRQPGPRVQQHLRLPLRRGRPVLRVHGVVDAHGRRRAGGGRA